MADGKEIPQPESADTKKPDLETPQKPRKAITRRDFLIQSNAGAVAAGVMAGTGFAAAVVQAQHAATAEPPKPHAAATAAPAATAAVTAAPMTTRRVTLDIDRKKYDVTVDVRESLWETMNYQLGLSNSNMGCDRAQCGACAVLVDGKAVNGCTVLTARLGRGQKILTVAGIATGPGPEGLHPLQRAFWLDGGFQCGICTRGFIMSSYALLSTNKNPSVAQIKEALSGNICRCGEYAKILTAVQKAAAEMRGEKVTYNAPLVQLEEAKAPAPAAGPAVAAVSKQFEFVTALGTIEQFDDLSLELKGRPGVVAISGSERTISVSWDPAKLDEARVRQMLNESGHPVK